MSVSAPTTPDELVQVLLAIRGARPVTFTARTDAGTLAKDRQGNPNPHARPIWKTATVNGMVNFLYDRGVLKRLKAERKSLAAFRSGSSWHLPVLVDGKLTPLCTGRAEDGRVYYLRVMCLRLIGDPLYHDADGKPLAEPDVAPFLRPRTTYRNQGLAEPLVFKTYSLTSLLRLTIDGRTYQLN